MAGHTREWSNTRPAPTEQAGLGYQEIQYLRKDIDERMDLDHNWGIATATASAYQQDGTHKQVTLTTGSAPSGIANAGRLYVSDDASKAELFYISESGGSAVQITSGTSIGSDSTPLICTTATISGAVTMASTLAVTGNLTINTNKFIVTAVNGNTTVGGTLGVTGAITTAGTLDVAGPVTLGSTLSVTGRATFTSTIVTSAGSAALPAIYPTGDANTGIWFPAADTVAISTGGSERVRINSSGKIATGGETSPAVVAGGIHLKATATGKAFVIKDESTEYCTITNLGAATLAGATTISNTTNSTSYATGALIVGGGVGIYKDVFINGSISVAGALRRGGVGTIGSNTTDTSLHIKTLTISVVSGAAYGEAAHGIANGRVYILGIAGFRYTDDGGTTFMQNFNDTTGDHVVQNFSWNDTNLVMSLDGVITSDLYYVVEILYYSA